MKSENLKTAGLVVAILVLNFILKGIYLSANSLGWDEPFSVFHSQLEIGQIVDLLSEGNNPPLYEIMLHYWTKLFGLSEFSVRFPSLIFSSVTAVIVFLTGRRHFSLPVAITAALLFSFSNYQVFFAHEARVYAFFGMMAAASMYVFLDVCSKQIFSNRNLILLILFNTVLIYAHYFGFFILFIQLLTLISISSLWKTLWKKYLLHLAVLVLFYLPLVTVVLNRFLDSASEGTWVQAPNNLNEIYEMLRRFTNAPAVTVSCLVLLFSALILFFVRRSRVIVSVQHKIILVWFFVPFFLMFILSFWIPMFVDRYLIYLTVPLYMLIAFSANFIFQNKKIAVALQTVIVLLFAITCKPNLDNKRHVEETIAKINDLKKPETRIYFCPQSFVFNYAYYEDIKYFQNINLTDPTGALNKE